MKEPDIEQIIRKITLNVFHIGSKEKNFFILESLPNNVEQIMKETGLTKVPVNKHLNELEKYGLLKRQKGTGNVYPTEMTNLFKLLIMETEKHVKINVSKMLPDLIK